MNVRVYADRGGSAVARRVGLIFAVIQLALPVCSCGRPSLTRGSAAELLLASDSFERLSNKAHLQPQGFRKLVDEEFATRDTKTGKFSLTEKGRKVVRTFDDESLTPAEDLQRPEVDITGIADAVIPLGSSPGGAIKEVQFNWGYHNVPSPLARFIVQGGAGSALFRLYDDGWRIEECNIRYSEAPYGLSQEESAEEAAEVAAIEANRRAKEEANQRRLTQAQTASEEVATLPQCCDYMTNNRATLRVTNVNFTAYDYCNRPPITVWFGDIKRLRTYSGDIPGLLCSPAVNVYCKRRGKRFGGEDEVRVHFPDDAARDRAMQVISSALGKWRAQYPDLSE